MAAYTFDATLTRPEGVGTWTNIDIPLDLVDLYGKKGQVKVRGTVNSCPFRGTAIPHGDGRHYLVIAKPIREAIGATQGDTVHVLMEIDTEERTVIIPMDLAAALQKDQTAQAIFEKIAYSHRKNYVEWIESAKKAETRQSRIEKAVEMIKAGERLKG